MDFLKVVFFVWTGWFLLQRSTRIMLTCFERLHIRFPSSGDLRHCVFGADWRYLRTACTVVTGGCLHGIYAGIPELLYLVTCALSAIPFVLWYDSTVSFSSNFECRMSKGFIVSSPNRGVFPGLSNGASPFHSLASTRLGSVLSLPSPSPLPGRRKSPGTDCITW
jgi:hypothetical protein